MQRIMKITIEISIGF